MWMVLSLPYLLQLLGKAKAEGRGPAGSGSAAALVWQMAHGSLNKAMLLERSIVGNKVISLTAPAFFQWSWNNTGLPGKPLTKGKQKESERTSPAIEFRGSSEVTPSENHPHASLHLPPNKGSPRAAGSYLRGGSGRPPGAASCRWAARR